MSRLLKMFAMTGMMLVLTTAAVMAGDVPAPGEGADEFILQAAVQHLSAVPTAEDPQPAAWAINVTGAWGHYLTANTEFGVATRVFRIGGNGGAGIGPFYEFSLIDSGSGTMFIGGDLLGLTGDAGDTAEAAGRARIGWKQRIHPKVTLRSSFEVQKPVLVNDSDQKDTLDQVAFLFGFSILAPKPTTP